MLSSKSSLFRAAIHLDPLSHIYMEILLRLNRKLSSLSLQAALIVSNMNRNSVALNHQN